MKKNFKIYQNYRVNLKLDTLLDCWKFQLWSPSKTIAVTTTLSTFISNTNINETRRFLNIHENHAYILDKFYQ